MNLSYKVIGLMSGTSLDGVDLAYCSFNYFKGLWEYTIPESRTYPYPDELKVTLKNAIQKD